MSALWLTFMWLASGCGSSHDVSVGTADGGTSSGMDGAGPGTDGGPLEVDSGLPTPPPGHFVCGDEMCTPGQECCFLTGSCFDPADPSGCMLPAGAGEGRCASNRDCRPDQVCLYDGEILLCFGALGTCRTRNEICSDPPSLGVCGCDGRNYRSYCDARQAGVRVLHHAACGRWIGYPIGDEGRVFCGEDGSCPPGWSCTAPMNECAPDRRVIACGLDAHCPEGQTCCTMTGVCLEASRADDCRVAPVDTWLPCRTDLDCQTAFRIPRVFCGRDGCGSPGGCMQPITDECSGLLLPVCGCNGMTYTNVCGAERAGQGTLHEGECTP